MADPPGQQLTYTDSLFKSFPHTVSSTLCFTAAEGSYAAAAATDNTEQRMYYEKVKDTTQCLISV